MFEDLRLKIEETLRALLENIGSELVELKIRRQVRTLVVDIIADRPQGGITLDECGYLNKQINQKIEDEHWIQGDYVVEVSSPGIDRPLKTSKDFLRVQGRHVRFHLTEPLENRVEYSGIVKHVDQNSVMIDFKTKMTTIPLEKIQKAVQVVI